MPDGALVIGHKYTLAAKINNNIYLLNYTHGSYAQIGTDFGSLIIWPDSKIVEIRINQATSIVVDWVSLVEGEYTADTLPEYQPKGYAAELAECQRYYKRYSSYGINSYWGFGTSAAQSAVIANIPIVFDLPMRDGVNPTFGYGGNFRIRGANAHEITNLSVTQNNSYGSLIQATTTDAVAGQAGVLQGNNDPTAYIEFSADL